MSKNLLFIHHVSFMGGAERYLLSLIEALPEDYKVFFICQEPGPLSEAIKATGAQVAYMPLRAWRKPRFFFHNILTVKTIINFCKANHIDLICSNNYRVTPYAVKVARALKIPVVTILQDFVDASKLKKFKTLLSDHLITVSDSLSKSVRPYFKGGITRIYNGLDIDAYIATAKDDVLHKEFPNLKDKRVIGMMAQIVPVKGHKVFLKSMQKIAQEFEDVRFVIIGASPSEEQLSIKELQAYATELGIADKIIWTGTRADASSLLQSFHILVHPAFKEPFGRVVLEAMALGVPVVATNSGGPGEIIEHPKSGLLVKVGDDETITKAVQKLLSNQDMYRIMSLAAKGRSYQFHLNNTVIAIGPTLDQILRKAHED